MASCFKINVFVFIFSCIVFQCVISESEQDGKYTTKYDNVDLEQLLQNERLLKNYVDCLMESGPCTPDGLELRQTMPDAIESDCSKCSDKQKEGSAKIIRFLIDNKPEYWTPLQEKYDPTGSYKKRYDESKKSEAPKK